MDTFEIQEIAIYQPNGPWKGLSGPGTECEIMEVGAIGPQSGKQGYRCYFPGDPAPTHFKGWWFVPTESLRKKKYDGNKVTSWDECIWRPAHETI